MTNKANTVISFEDRIKKAAKILKKHPRDLNFALNQAGIDSLEILDSAEVSIKDITDTIAKSFIPLGEIPPIKAKVAAGILKTAHEVAEIVELPKKESDSSVLADLIKSQRPVTQWSDNEVLDKYIKTDDEQYESELQRRAKNRRFIILKEGTQEEVDVEASLVMLKRARKDDIPSFVTSEDKRVIHIYKVEEYHVSNRVRYESPLRPGVMLFDGFCQVSNQNFKKVPDTARKFLRLIHNVEGNQSRMEETRLVEIAEEGIDGLGRIFPEVLEQYMELASTDNLPSLKTIAPVETRQADPFYQKSGNRTY